MANDTSIVKFSGGLAFVNCLVEPDILEIDKIAEDGTCVFKLKTTSYIKHKDIILAWSTNSLKKVAWRILSISDVGNGYKAGKALNILANGGILTRNERLGIRLCEREIGVGIHPRSLYVA